MEVDFAGKTFSLVDGQTGEVFTIVVFVAILPYSQYIYAEGIRVFGDELINMLFAIRPGLHYLPLSSCLIAIA
jgi:hypothetical protein